MTEAYKIGQSAYEFGDEPETMAVKCQKNTEKVHSKRGRPSTGFDKRAYMKEYMRKRRLALKQAKT